MNNCLGSGTTSSATFAIIVVLLGFGGCKRETVSVSTREEPDSILEIRQDTPPAQNANPLAGLADTISSSETNIFDPAAPDEKFAGTTMEALQTQGETGDPEALAELGRRYETGAGTNIDYKKAAKSYQSAAEKQNVDAIVRLGLMYQQGSGVRIDSRQGAMWFRIAADSNHPFAMARLGKLYLEGIGVDRELKTAAKWLRKAAEQGEPDAMLEIADLLESGMFGEQDFEEASRVRSKAREFMESAATDDNVRAMRWLAESAIANEPGQAGFDEAHRWLLRASELGDTIAMVRLAELLAADPADTAKQAEAITWCTKAAERLEPSALLLLADFHDRGYGMPPDVWRAFELRKQSAERGDIRGMRLCAEMLMQGWGTNAQLEQGLRWYQLAAGLGDGPSMAQVGICFKEGRGYEKNDAMAVAYFTRGVAHNDPESLYQLAVCHESGAGVSEDLIKAAQGYQRSAGLGHRDAMFRLADLLSRQDNGLKASAADAVSWYELAALKGHLGAAERLAQMYARGDRVEQSEQLAAAWKARVEAPPVRVDGVARPPANFENATPWGTLTAPKGDGATSVDGDTLILTLNVAWDRLKPGAEGAPPESPEVENRNLPRILQDVSGDFTAEVTLPGPLKWVEPETVIDETTSPTGVAGILIWVDEENFARLDRVGTLQGDQIQYTCDFLITREGTQVFHGSKALSVAAVGLRFERSGDRLRASLTQNGGQSWTNFRSQVIDLPPAAKIGIAAFNNSDKPLIAEFQRFTLVIKD